MVNVNNPMLVHVYHGSYDVDGMKVIKEVVADDYEGIKKFKVRKNTDFGPAFYLTNRMPQASMWSVRLDTNGWLCSFVLNLTNLKVLNLDPMHKPPLRWIAELVYNRHFKSINDEEWDYIVRNWRKNSTGYDVILGYTADDQYFSIFDDFFSNNLSFTGLCKVMMLGNLGYQYAVRSHKAYKALTRLKNQKIDKTIWHPRFLEHQNLAKRQYEEIRTVHGRNAVDELSFHQIVSMGIKPEDERVAFPRRLL